MSHIKLKACRVGKMRSGNTVKTCAKCKESVRVENFHKDSKTIDGLYIYCKACSIERARLYYNRNKLKILKRRKELKAILFEGINLATKKILIEKFRKRKTFYQRKYREKKKLEKISQLKK